MKTYYIYIYILSFDFHDKLCSFYYSIIISILQMDKENLVNSHSTESDKKRL